MHHAVEDRRGGKPAGEQLVPSAHGQVGRNDEGALFVPLADHLEEKALSFPVHVQVGQFVDDQELDLFQFLQRFPEGPVQHPVMEPVHQLLRVRKEHLVSRIDGVDADPCGDHALPDTGRADDQDIFVRLKEAKVPEVRDLIPVERVVKVVIDVLQMLF